MSFVAFIPGLKGPNSDFAKEAYTTTTLRSAIGAAAEVLQLEYQTPENILPAFNRMGLMIAADIMALQEKHGHHGVVVASSVGGKALINALPFLEFKPEIVMIAPVIDTTAKIVQLGAMHKASAGLGQIIGDKTATAAFPVPVSYNKEIEENPGAVMATRKHLLDPYDYRLLHNADAEYGDMNADTVAELKTTGREIYEWQYMSGSIPSLTILAGAGDPYCMPHEIAAFKAIAQPVTATPIEEVIWQGGHNEMGDRENDIVAAVTRKLGLASRPAVRLVPKTGPQNG